MRKMLDLELYVSIIGQSAFQTVHSKGKAIVLGVTSKGVFLQNSVGQICFISQEPFHGPLTVNLIDSVDLSASFYIGESCQINGNSIEFPDCRILIHKDTPIWEPSPICISELNVDQVLNRGNNLARQIKGDYQNGFFIDFFDALQEKSLEPAWKTLLNSIPDGKGDSSNFGKLPALLGLGGGLTPSGDDFICGFLLTRYYLGKTLPAFELMSEYIERIIASAYKRTTALSAALIACAAEGQADERLMNLLHWLLSGEGETRKIKEELLSYGNSSGMDTFAGMLAAILLPADVT